MRFPTVRRHIGRLLPITPCSVARAAVLMAAVGNGAFAQDDEQRSADWNKVESAAETKTFKEAMKNNGGFDATARNYLEGVALPQLELEANRPVIEVVRRRLREVLLAEITNPKAADEANEAVLAFMEAVAAKQEAEPVVRVNAMLMIGELQGADRKPLDAAAPLLARAAADVALPKAVRIAACVGLQRHVEATRGFVEEQKRMAKDAGPDILAILGESPAPESAAADDWLVSRCLTMLPLLGPGTPDTVTQVARILADEARSIDVRVRAAAALAAIAAPDVPVDAAGLIPVVLAVAVTSLERDVAAADRLILERQFGGGIQPGPQQALLVPPGPIGGPWGEPAVEQLVPREVCRRAAWRLAVLADAILADDGKRGLALQVAEGEARTGFQQLAQKVRLAALELDVRPDDATSRDALLRQALAGLKPRPPAAKKEEQPESTDEPQ